MLRTPAPAAALFVLFAGPLAAQPPVAPGPSAPGASTQGVTGVSSEEGGDDPAAGDPDAPPPVVQVSVRPTSTIGSSFFSGGPNGSTTVNRSAAELLSSEFGSSGPFLDLRTVLPAGKFDLVARFPEDVPREDRAVITRAVVAAAFGVRVRTETRPVETLVLRVPEGGGSTLTPADPDPRKGASRMFRPGKDRQRIEMTKASAGVLAGALQQALGRPVRDETGLTGTYDITLDWFGRPADVEPAALREAVPEQTGLSLTEEDRDLEFTVVEAREGAGE